MFLSPYSEHIHVVLSIHHLTININIYIYIYIYGIVRLDADYDDLIKSRKIDSRLDLIIRIDFTDLGGVYLMKDLAWSSSTCGNFLIFSLIWEEQDQVLDRQDQNDNQNAKCYLEKCGTIQE